MMEEIRRKTSNYSNKDKRFINWLRFQVGVEINTISDGNKYAKYNNFTVTNEASNYTLFVGFYSGDVSDRLTYHNSMAFYTKDKDNDESGRN